MFYINGRFLTQNLTGVQRTGIELTKALDKIVPPKTIKILVPPGRINDIQTTNIDIEEIGKTNNNLWTQLEFARYVKKNNGKTISFAGIPPIINPDYFYIHDITYLRWPQSFNLVFRLSYYLFLRLAIKKSKKVITVSDFSKKEICDAFGISPDMIEVVYNASLFNIDNSVENTADNNNELYLCVGSNNIHKNQVYIYELARKHPRKTFVIAGLEKNAAFKNCSEYSNIKEENIIFLGHVSDEKLSEMYKKCRGFIFPSLYEGFGIPPLEAITMGVKYVAVSDIPVHREIYTKGVYFFDPKNSDDFDFDAFLNQPLSEADRLFYENKFSWDRSGNKLKTILFEE